ncbi:desmoglein-2, partial [Silurus meridionalis]
QIRSDEEIRTDIDYFLLGPAADERLFTVGRKNGFVKINGILDREKASSYELKGRAQWANGSLAERDLDLKIIVLDQNDCPPVFNVQVVGSVNELSEKGTHIIVITAIDADEPDTPHSQIAYEVIQQQPPGMMMFQIEKSTGEIRVQMNTLDREIQDTYRLIVRGTDMNGQNSDPKNRPLTGTGTVTISILDVNDNVPVLEKSYYEGSVEENTLYVEAVRIKAIDMDLIHTENWEAVYTIVSGNEAGYFNITTDSKTNEGILLVTKELDYELLKEVNLAVVVSNKAAYHKSVVIDKPKTYPIKINVVNIPEAPHFHPAVKVVSISEDRTTIDLRKVITTYTATDSDTLLTATNVRYIKGEDVDNWVNINEHTAEIRLNKYPDHESKFLVNGTYYAKIICITNDFSPKTATGTLAIQVQDFNDHCPVLMSSVEKLCYGNSVVYVTAKDGDKYPNAEPFEFKVVSQSTKENWSVERLNETTVILRSQEILWPGYYTVGLDVQDQQGKSCEVQKLQVDVCTCTEAQVCQAERQTSNSSVLGAGGVLALLLGILLLLLIPLILLLCECGGAAGFGHFQAFPFEQKQQLITYHTEGQGEDKVVCVFCFMLDIRLVLGTQDGGGGGGQLTSGLGAHEDWRKYGWESYEEYMNSQWCSKYDEYMKKQKNGFGGHAGIFTARSFEGMALSETYLGNYYERKTQEMVMQEASQDLLLISSYETCNSVTGSLEDLSICMQEENNLDFLNDLGPQFRRLAEISCGSAIELDFSSTSTPSKIISSSSQVGIKVDGAAAASGIHSEATSVSESNSSSTTQITTSRYGEKISSGNVTSAATAGQTLLVQQPTVYLSSAPMYLVENRQQPTLFLASGAVLGVQES